MIVKCKTQPVCRNCGKKIAKRTVRTYLRDAESEVKTREDAQRLTNLKVTSINYSQNKPFTYSARRARREGFDRRASSFSTWDGESYVSDCFCKGACAIAYAYRIARSTRATVNP